MLKSLLRFTFWLILTTGSGLAIGLSGMYLYLSPSLPAVDTLRNVKLQTPLKIYSADDKLIGEFGEKRRKPIKHQNIPQTYIDALLAAEDEGFYSHSGVSIKGLVRAVSHLLITGEKKSGGSTITMQVTREFFLHRKKHFKRKFNEILLALRIEQELNKSEILELYVNMIFLGNRAYGIQAAAEIYYGKPLEDLSTAQLAMIAGLQQAPSRNNPIANPVKAIQRRNWILGRMRELGTLDDEEYHLAINESVSAQYHRYQLDFPAPHVAEVARQHAVNLFGPSAYTDGYSVHTSIHSEAQRVAHDAVISGLYSYDKRHGYTGPELRTPEGSSIETQLEALNKRPKLDGLIPALITSISDTEIGITFSGGTTHSLLWETLKSNIRIHETEDRTRPAPEVPSELFATGDIIRLRETPEGWQLTQIPNIQGSLVSIDAYTGQVIALVGGYNFYLSSFNRVTQAQRQPGSNFKPFLYTAALENGLSAATLINDAPIVFDDAKLETTWRPKNSNKEFHGPTRLRKALYLSRNLVSIRVLKKIGIRNAIEGIGRFGIDKKELPRDLTLALGSHAMKPIDVATGYAVFANGGYKVKPYFIDHITNDLNEIVYRSNKVQVCNASPCIEEAPFMLKGDAFALSPETQEKTQAHPAITNAPRVLSEEVVYVMDSILKDVVRRGTATKARNAIKRADLAGKTGTTNGPTDAWFSGYAGGIVTTTWVGFDNYDKLGQKEYGGSAALPIWIDFMKATLKDRPEIIQPQPANIVSVRIDPETGARARPQDPDAIFEIFRVENAPKETSVNNANTEGPFEYQEDIF